MKLKSILCDYSDDYILVKGTITVPKISAASVAANNNNIKTIFKDCALFTDCISQNKQYTNR